MCSDQTPNHLPSSRTTFSQVCPSYGEYNQSAKLYKGEEVLSISCRDQHPEVDHMVALPAVTKRPACPSSLIRTNLLKPLITDRSEDLRDLPRKPNTMISNCDETENFRRMLAGELYFAQTPRLIKLRRQCRLAVARFNKAGEMTRREMVEHWKA